MYRTSEIQNEQNMPKAIQQCDDDCDSVEIEMQDEDEFIHQTLPTHDNAATKLQSTKGIHKRHASRDVEYINLDMFEDYGDKLDNFVKTTPYIDKLLETSQQYRMFMESLKLLAAFNDGLTHVLSKVKDLSKADNKVMINRAKGTNIIKKNRELRVQLKLLINDNGANLNGNMTNDGNKRNKTKRALLNERDTLLKIYDEVLIKFKKYILL